MARLVRPAVLVVLGLLLDVLRPAQASQRFGMWAEDGNVFASQARTLGARAFTTSYNGYLHLLPRSAAALAAALPIADTPVVLAVVAALAAAVAAACAWCALRSVGVSPSVALLGWALVLLLPSGGYEPVGNITNVQWPCLAGELVFACAWVAGWRPRRWLAASVLVVVGLTSPLAGVAVPLLLIGWWRTGRRTADLVPTAALVVTTAVQGVVRMTHSVTAPPHVPDGAASLAAHAYAWRIAVGGLVGDRLDHRALTTLGGGGTLAAGISAIVVLGVLAVLAIVVGHRRTRPSAGAAALAALALSLLVFVVSAALRPDFLPVAVIDPASGGLVAGRYVVIPGTMVGLAALLVLDALVRPAATRTARHSSGASALRLSWRLVPYGLGLLAAAGVLAVNFRLDAHRLPSAVWHAGLARATAACAHEAPSATAYIPNAPGAFGMNLPCRLVDAGR